jgi:hypothetical protein
VPSILCRAAAASACLPGVAVAGVAGPAQAEPPAAAQCQQAYRLPCLGADQIEQAYSLPALYREGITGSGTTIAIVDPYGSPTIAADLSAFDAGSGLPAASYRLAAAPAQPAVPPATRALTSHSHLPV